MHQESLRRWLHGDRERRPRNFWYSAYEKTTVSCKRVGCYGSGINIVPQPMAKNPPAAVPPTERPVECATGPEPTRAANQWHLSKTTSTSPTTPSAAPSVSPSTSPTYVSTVPPSSSDKPSLEPMMINGIVIGVGLYARAIPYTSPRLLPRK